MARYHYWQYLVDSEGRPLQNVNIRFYLADAPTEEAEIFTHPNLGGTTTTSESDVKTDGNGFFEFWVGDEFESVGGYTSTQQFKLTWERAGIFIGTIDYVDVFPPILKVDETDNVSSVKDQKNRTISNLQAYQWESHRTSTVPTDSPHGILPVDVNDSADNTFNKTVSNSLMNFLLAAISSAGTLSIGASAATERNFTIDAGSWAASGSELYYVQLDHFIGRRFPLVQIRDTNTDLMVKPNQIRSTSNNSIQVIVTDNTLNAHVTVIG